MRTINNPTTDIGVAEQGLLEIAREQSAATAQVAADRFQRIARETLAGMGIDWLSATAGDDA
jgi:hypothetical protein